MQYIRTYVHTYVAFNLFYLIYVRSYVHVHVYQY